MEFNSEHHTNSLSPVTVKMPWHNWSKWFITSLKAASFELISMLFFFSSTLSNHFQYHISFFHMLLTLKFSINFHFTMSFHWMYEISWTHFPVDEFLGKLFKRQKHRLRTLFSKTVFVHPVEWFIGVRFNESQTITF